MRLSSIRTHLENAALVIGASILACALFFAGGEAWLRAKYGAMRPGPTGDMRLYEAQRGWAIRPGQYAYFDVAAMRPVHASVNALGLRQGPLAPVPAPGVERISIIGDSFIFGLPVAQHETIPAQFQDLAGPRYEVVNISAPGYGTGQELRLVEALHARGYQLGKRVVLSFFTNDLQDNLGLDYSTLVRNPRQPMFGVDAHGQLVQDAVAPPKPRRGDRPDGIDGFMVTKFLRYQAEVAVAGNPVFVKLLDRVGVMPSLPRVPGIVSGWYSPRWEERWRVTDSVLEHAVRSLRALPGAPEVSILFVPSPFQMPGAFRATIEANAADPRYAAFLADTDRPQRLVGALAARLGVPFIDLTPRMRAASERSLPYFPREGHFNEVGCRLAAGVLHEALLGRQSGRTAELATNAEPIHRGGMQVGLRHEAQQ